MHKSLSLILVIVASALVWPLASCPIKPSHPHAILDGMTMERLFDGRRFKRAVYAGHDGTGNGALYVAEQAGRILRFADPNSADAEVFVDLSAKVSRKGNEEGLLGLAFHPRFAQNRRVFLHYSKAEPREGVIAEFRVRNDGMSLDPASERVIMKQSQPYSNHNGGSIEFGPDGFLYVSFGDGGAAADPGNRSQDLSTLLGKILRIDVDALDGDTPYSIPPDNPFVDTPGARREIWALGLRNTWRMSFDRRTGELWGGDVGQWKLEEINIVVRGGNYGWRRMEAGDKFADTELSTERAISPVASYGRREGFSVTGGHVYRGARMPALDGVYLFGDYASGRIWGLYEQPDGSWERRTLIDTFKRIASFGVDGDQEILVCDHDGGVYRLDMVEKQPMQQDELPERLADASFFQKRKRWMPYQVQSPLWSDGLKKERFVLLAPGTSIDVGEEDLAFPEGATFIKEFSTPDGPDSRKLETRVIIRRNGGFLATSYLWNDKQTEALRVDEPQRIFWSADGLKRAWQVPGRNQCSQCHTAAAGFVLGFEPEQIHDRTLKRRLYRRKVISRDVARLPLRKEIVDPRDTSRTLDERARSYLHANCAGCHQPGGGGNGPLDLRAWTPLDQASMLDTEPLHGVFGRPGAKVVTAGNADDSVLFMRMNSRGIGHMPPLGSALVDEQAVELVRSWINSL